MGAALILVGLLSGASQTGSLDLGFDKVRSTRGVLRICLTSDPRNFPSCKDDARAITRTVPASERSVHFDDLPYGSYAIAVIHDENRNKKLDTFVGIPKEGFGFSRNPATFGPPKFTAAAFEIGAKAAVQRINLRYLL